jgi:zinc protease
VLDPQSFTVYIVPRPGIGLAEAEAQMDAVIAAFIEEGPDPVQLERVKTQLGAEQIYALDDQHRRARRIGSALTSGLTLEDVAAWPAALQAVSAEDVVAAAQAVFRPEASVTGWLMAAAEPEPAAETEPDTAAELGQ